MLALLFQKYFFTILTISRYIILIHLWVRFWPYLEHTFRSFLIPMVRIKKIETYSFKLAMHKNIKSTNYRLHKQIFLYRMPHTWCHKLTQSFYGDFFIFYIQCFALIFLVQRFLIKRIFEEIKTITFFSLFIFLNLLFNNEEFPSNVDALCQVCLILFV